MYFDIRKLAYAGLISVLLSSSASATGPDNISSELSELKSTLQRLNKVLEAQQKRITELETKSGIVATPVEIKSVTSYPTTLSSGQKISFNPDIGVVADIVATSTENKEDEEGNDRLAVRELELNIGHDVDPFSRFDSVITFSDFEDVSLEEAYLSHWGLPWDLRGKIGRFRPFVGKSTILHRDGLDTVDYPIVVQQYFGVEGYSRSGGEVSYSLPFSFDTFTSDLTLGVLEGGIGEGGNLFGETRRRPTYYGHLKNFWELSDTQNIELGGSYLIGSADEDSKNESKAIGVDLTYINYITPQNKLKLQAEMYLQDRDSAAAESDVHAHSLELEDLHEEEEHHDESGIELDPAFDSSPFGMYALADYRLSPSWGVGARFDYVEPVNLSIEVTEDATKAYTGYLTFYQSEFARFRFQYQHVDLADGTDDERFFLQATAAIGYHKHKLN